MDSRTYWKQRESEQLKCYITEEVEYQKHINNIYDYMMDQIQKEINGFYVKYAKKEGITLSEAKKRVSKLDIEEYGRKAAKYVKEKNFSKEANDEMRLYNATMKINRLELLKANIGLELVDGFNELQKYYGEVLTDRSMEEFRHQAGILGSSIQNNEKAAHAIVNASFHNAKYSDRIWMYQDMMKAELDKLLRQGLIQGKHPRELARHLARLFGVSKSNAERLMRTELARVQIEAQMQSFERNGYEEYEFIALGDSACEKCRKLDRKHFKVKSMMPGENAPPMHPNCRCSTAAYMDDEEYEKWLEKQGRGKLEDVTQEYLDKATLGKGILQIDSGVDTEKNAEDIKIAEWLKQSFGGDIRVVKDSNKYKEGTPDYIWNGLKWELKSPSSKNAIDKRMQKAGHQLGENGGGMVIDISSARALTTQEAIDYIVEKLPKRAKGNTDLIIVKDKRLIKIIRYEKK